MGRGVSAGGGQSSLGYLFGNGEPANNSPVAKNVGNSASSSPSPKPASASPPIDKQTPAGIHGMEILRTITTGQMDRTVATLSR
jgi:SPIRAL1-like protein